MSKHTPEKLDEMAAIKWFPCESCDEFRHEHSMEIGHFGNGLFCRQCWLNHEANRETMVEIDRWLDRNR